MNLVSVNSIVMYFSHEYILGKFSILHSSNTPVTWRVKSNKSTFETVLILRKSIYPVTR